MKDNLFISHSWTYSDAYDRLVGLLDNASYFSYRNYSVPKDNPIQNAPTQSQLKEAIKAQMVPTSCVLILAGVYSTYSKWINIEIDLAKNDLYRCIQHHCGVLQRELRLGGEQIPPNSRELFFDFQAQLTCRGLTDIQRAARYFYVIRTSYGADRRTFGCSKKALTSAIDRLPEIQQKLRDVVIENRDFKALFKTYNKPNTLFYLDPPYYKAEKYYAGFSMDDHQRLRRTLDNAKGFFLLSYNNAPEIRRMYADFNIQEVERSNNLAHKKGSGTARYKELIITNY